MLYRKLEPIIQRSKKSASGITKQSRQVTFRTEQERVCDEVLFLMFSKISIV